MTKGEKALRLLEKVMPFLDAAPECLVCGGTPGHGGHEYDCFVIEIEKLMGHKIWESPKASK